MPTFHQKSAGRRLIAADSKIDPRRQRQADQFCRHRIMSWRALSKSARTGRSKTVLLNVKLYR